MILSEHPPIEAILVSINVLKRCGSCSQLHSPGHSRRFTTAGIRTLRIGATQVYCDRIRVWINNMQELSKAHEATSKANTKLRHWLLTHYLPLCLLEIAGFTGNSCSD